MNALRRLRIFWMLWVTTMVLACASAAVAQVSYQVIDLGTLHGDNLGCAMAVNQYGWTETMDGIETPVSSSISGHLAAGRAVINIGVIKIDLGTLGGPNSWINFGGINDYGEAVGFAETSVPDPDGEDICGFGTKLTCRPFIWKSWQYPHMKALPTVGGNNGQAAAINNRGQIAGYAQTAVMDSTCPPTQPSQTTSAVLWENGQAQALPTVDSDPDGIGEGINQQGQAVGYSGTCTAANHAVSWTNGTATALPDLGTGALAFGVNNQGQIVGTVGSADGTTQYGALWQNGELTNLGTLPGDFAAIATGINDKGQVVGSTWNSSFDWSHAFIWQDNVMTDLNTLFPANSNLYAIMANQINDRGQIAGMATVLSGPHKGDIHAFLAIPVHVGVRTSVADVTHGHPPHSNSPASVREQLLRRFMLGRLRP